MRKDVEEWRVVEEDPRYEVSNLGRVRSWCARGRYADRRAKKPRLCTLSVHRQGYIEVPIGTSRRYVHRLMALAFIGPCPDGQEVRHLDDVKFHNTLDNLAYGTRGENMRDAYRNGSYDPVERSRNARRAAIIGAQKRRRA